MHQFHKFIVPSWSWSKAIYKPVWHIPLLSVQWINSWWWAEQLSETCRVSCQNKFVKLMHLVGFIIKKCDTLIHVINSGNWWQENSALDMKKSNGGTICRRNLFKDRVDWKPQRNLVDTLYNSHFYCTCYRHYTHLDKVFDRTWQVL